MKFLSWLSCIMGLALMILGCYGFIDYDKGILVDIKEPISAGLTGLVLLFVGFICRRK